MGVLCELTPNATSTEQPQPQLKREVGVFGATMMELGSIIGTGGFVSIGVVAGVSD